MNITQDFIDERFKAYVLENFCENREWIQKSDVDRIVSLKLAKHGYSSLKGIEHFASLEELDCGFNHIRDLDVSQNAKLTKLDCYWNIISELQIDQNTNLKELNCSYNAMFDLQLDYNTQLTYLNCGNNYLISLNITGCSNLIEPAGSYYQRDGDFSI
ncbi:hypothetical protein [Paenibacillus sp. L3-i20]|uniref:hypothetical protein n=1 Tax=Paenibacillus sp. L3-i20 TaxID=2905833 RepID=UPI001EE1338A|nr:hypothetical protein [Paenibacillus sp. L3-i20]GKU76055.1 hypothetical protein L3i20_v204520 [Paenibacillus sp. L3-i20]